MYQWNALRRGIWVPIAALVLCVTALTHSHEEHESATAGETETTPAVVNWDSLYALINVDYQRVEPLFKRGCFDCHSARTAYPWYHRLPIVRGFLDGHIREGRKHLDLTNGFPFTGHTKPADDLFAIREVLVENEMPLWSYRLLHWGAAPSQAEKDSIYTWINAGLRLLAAHGQYPFGRPELVELEIDD